MFETFAADTIPLIPKYFSHALDLYGNGAKELVLTDRPETDILRILDNYEHHKKLSAEIRNQLKDEHSYEKRLTQLLEFI